MSTKAIKKEIENIIKAATEAKVEQIEFLKDLLSKNELRSFEDGADLILNILRNYII